LPDEAEDCPRSNTDDEPDEGQGKHVDTAGAALDKLPKVTVEEVLEEPRTS